MIHYHGTPIWGVDAPVLSLQGKHACVSFEHSEQIEIIAEVCQSFMVDNGAFTKWKKGGAVDLKDFSEFIEHWCYHPGFDWYLIPDVIDGSEKDNYELREEWFVTYPKLKRFGVPIWHLHESLESLEAFSQLYPIVAIGSSGEYATVGNNAWWQRMAEAMPMVCDELGRPRCKLHGLRMLDPTIFSHFPLSSADSTNVARSIGFDHAWRGPYAPSSKKMKAMLMIDRVETHASASRWVGSGGMAVRNGDLFG